MKSSDPGEHQEIFERNPTTLSRNFTDFIFNRQHICAPEVFLKLDSVVDKHAAEPKYGLSLKDSTPRRCALAVP